MKKAKQNVNMSLNQSTSSNYKSASVARNYATPNRASNLTIFDESRLSEIQMPPTTKNKFDNDSTPTVPT